MSTKTCLSGPNINFQATCPGMPPVPLLYPPTYLHISHSPMLYPSTQCPFLGRASVCVLEGRCHTTCRCKGWLAEGGLHWWAWSSKTGPSLPFLFHFLDFPFCLDELGFSFFPSIPPPPSFPFFSLVLSFSSFFLLFLLWFSFLRPPSSSQDK